MSPALNLLHKRTFEQLKLAIGKMENKAKSAKTELNGANSRIERLRGKLHEFQTVIRDLRAKEAASLASQDASTSKPMEEVDAEVFDTADGKSELERLDNFHSIPAKSDAMVRIQW
jgi:phage shock protein A